MRSNLSRRDHTSGHSTHFASLCLGANTTYALDGGPRTSGHSRRELRIASRLSGSRADSKRGLCLPTVPLAADAALSQSLCHEERRDGQEGRGQGQERRQGGGRGHGRHLATSAAAAGPVTATTSAAVTTSPFSSGSYDSCPSLASDHAAELWILLRLLAGELSVWPAARSRREP